jgi:hypothetical protein
VEADRGQCHLSRIHRQGPRPVRTFGLLRPRGMFA